jgi:uncharacterized protein (DUF1499 family)
MTRFAPPPSSPNCVSSRADAGDKVHHIRPLAGTDLSKVKAVVQGMPRTEIVEEADGYLKAVFTSALFRFKDDVEFEQEGDVVHVRSASRVGYGDLGANRKRVEAIRAALG